MEPVIAHESEPISRTSRKTKLLALLALVAIVGYAVTRPSSAASFRASGTPVPLPEAGQLTELSADDFEGVLVGLRGTPVIVNIWASWCAPCRTETPLLERTWQPTAAKWSSSAWNPKTFFARSLFFMKEFGVTYPDCSFCLRARLAGIGRSVGARCYNDSAGPPRWPSASGT